MFSTSYYNVFIRTLKVWKLSKNLSSISKVIFEFLKASDFSQNVVLRFNLLWMIIIQGWLSLCFRIKDCIVPEPVIDTVRPTGSRLALFYGLPKTHKDELAMACTKTRNSETPEHLGTPEHSGTAKKPQNSELKLTVLFCFPITNHVKNEMSV